MRIAVLIVGLILGAVVFVQAALVNGLSKVANDQATEQAGAVGVFVAFLWLIACATVLPLPRVALALFAAAGVFGLAVSGDYPDMAVWGVVSFGLAVMSYFGYRGKRRDQAKQALLLEAAHAQIRLAGGTPSPASASAGCGVCGAANPPGFRFCSSCGGRFAAPAEGR